MSSQQSVYNRILNIGEITTVSEIADLILYICDFTKESELTPLYRSVIPGFQGVEVTVGTDNLYLYTLKQYLEETNYAYDMDAEKEHVMWITLRWMLHAIIHTTTFADVEDDA
jgi:hypothetical protein